MIDCTIECFLMMDDHLPNHQDDWEGKRSMATPVVRTKGYAAPEGSAGAGWTASGNGEAEGDWGLGGGRSLRSLWFGARGGGGVGFPSDS